MAGNSNNMSDGEKTAFYLSDMSAKGRTLGRSLVISIIGASWALSFSKGVFCPSCYIKWSLILALSYLFLDLFYYLLMTGVFKYILVHFFDDKPNEGFVYKSGKNASKCTKEWMNFGFYWMIAMFLLLLVSSLCMIIHVYNIQVSHYIF